MSTKQNILVIMTDQQHFQAISANGNSFIKTPAMDSLINNGTSFMNAYTPYPVCGPARASFFTGKMPCETGVYNNGFNIKHGIPHMGQWFSNNGYETALAGKWHIRAPRTSVIPGFDVITTGINIQGHYSDTSVTVASEGYLRNYNQDKPFLLMAMYVQPHDICGYNKYYEQELEELYELDENSLPPIPLSCKPMEKEPKRIIKRRQSLSNIVGNWDERKYRTYLWHYYRYVEMVDYEISRLLQTLKDTGLDENTLVIFTTDHGENTAHHQLILKNTLYNESIRVPLVFKDKNIPVKRIKDNVSLIDVFPTLCDYANIEKPTDISGISLLPLIINNQPLKRDSVIIEAYGCSGRAIIKGDYKYICFNDDDQEQLFDLKNDSEEINNLCDDINYLGIKKQLKKEIDEWFSTKKIAQCIPQSSRWSSD